MGNRIKDLRLEKGLSQRKLSVETGVSQQALSLYEKGERNPKIETWQKLADYFDVSVSYLQGLGMSENEFKEKLFDAITYSPNFAQNIAGHFSGVNKKNILSLSDEVTKDNYQELKGDFISFFDIKTIDDRYNFFSSIDTNISDNEFQNIVLDKLNNDNVSVFDFSYMFPDLHKKLINIFNKMTIEDEYFILDKIGKDIVFDELKKHYQERIKKESKEKSNNVGDES